MEGPSVKLDGLLCGGLYKEVGGSIVTWPGTEPDAKMNFFTWSRKDDYWVFKGYKDNNKFKIWQGPIHNGQFRAQSPNKMRRT